MELVYLIIGLVVGGLVGVLFQRNREAKEKNDSIRNFSRLSGEDVEILKNEISALKTQLINEKTSLNNKIHELDKANGIQGNIIENQKIQTVAQENKIHKQQEDNQKLAGENIKLTAINSSLEEKLATQKIALETLQKRFITEFENIAQKILKQNSADLTEVNQKKIGEILNPLKEKLSDFEAKVQNTYEKGLKDRSALAMQIKTLNELNQQMLKDANNLTKALKGDSKTQGNWGEIQLEMILNKAGLERDIHYTKEENIKTADGGNQRLDYIIKLPDNKRIIIDSKVSLTAYSNYFNEENEAEKEKYFKAHLESVNSHIRLLSEKNYQNLDIIQPDYVMLFLANEPALTLALKKDGKLFEKALGKNIVLVSSSTLLATLRTISYIWKTDNQNKNAREIAVQAGKLYEKFVGFTADLIDVGKRIDGATASYEKAMNKLSTGRGNLVGQIEKMKKMGAATSNTINPALIEQAMETEHDESLKINSPDIRNA